MTTKPDPRDDAEDPLHLPDPPDAVPPDAVLPEPQLPATPLPRADLEDEIASIRAIGEDR